MNESTLPKIIVICGPTASGKTELGIALAEAIGGEIVGADSLQVYRHFDIGSAKPTADQRSRVPHHMVDVCDPDESFNAALFKAGADDAISGITSRGRVPIVVGGTGLYLRILVRGIFDAPQPDEDLRIQLRAEMKAYGIEHLYKRLCLVDPSLAEKVEPHDQNRIMRGLEIFEQTGIALSEHQRVHDFGDPSYAVLNIGIKLNRKLLYQRIRMRTETMIKEGLLEEYRALRARGYSPDLKPMMSLGYRQMGDYEAGRNTFEEAVADIVRATKRYAKRQLTWFRKVPNILWWDFVRHDVSSLVADVKRFMSGAELELDWVCDEP